MQPFAFSLFELRPHTIRKAGSTTPLQTHTFVFACQRTGRASRSSSQSTEHSGRQSAPWYSKGGGCCDARALVRLPTTKQQTANSWRLPSAAAAGRKDGRTARRADDVAVTAAASGIAAGTERLPVDADVTRERQHAAAAPGVARARDDRAVRRRLRECERGCCCCCC